jgi:RNA polymerase sigma factor (sigma-70 family)
MPRPPGENSAHDPVSLLAHSAESVAALYSQTRAKEWGLSSAQFARGLERSVEKRFADGGCSAERLEEYLQTLHLEDLALAAACMAGSELAWESFFQEYRGYLRACAGAITKNSRAGTDARELADSLFAELYGLTDGKRGEHSLFRYFHGRSSLKTWLRTILAQRHIDRWREARKWQSIDGEDLEQNRSILKDEKSAKPNLDPHRDRYVGLFVTALESCLAQLTKENRLRLELYYAREMTLAEIGRTLGEHESSVSRNLDRVRKELRVAVEDHLRSRQALSDAETLLCVQYAAQDAPIDFRKLFPEKVTGRAEEEGKGTS